MGRKHATWVFADGDRFRFGPHLSKGGLVNNVRIVSTRPDANGSQGDIIQRAESDFLVVDEEGNFAGRLPQDADMYRAHGNHFRHYPNRGYKALSAIVTSTRDSDQCALDPSGYLDELGYIVPENDFPAGEPLRDARGPGCTWASTPSAAVSPFDGPPGVPLSSGFEPLTRAHIPSSVLNNKLNIILEWIAEERTADEHGHAGRAEFIAAATPALAANTPCLHVPFEDVDADLVFLLREAGKEWGARGVAEIACQIAGWVGPF